MKLSNYRQQVIFLMDVGIMIAVTMLIWLIAPTQMLEETNDLRSVLGCLIILLACSMVGQLVFRTYNSLWRYAGVKEYLNLTLGMALGLLLYSLTRLLPIQSFRTISYLSICAVSLILMMVARFFYRILRDKQYEVASESKEYVGIIGAGSGGVALCVDLERNTETPYTPYCFFDDDKVKIGKRVRGIEVKGPIADIPELVKNTPIHTLILAIPSLSMEKRKEIVNLCSKTNCVVKIVPAMVARLTDPSEKIARAVREVRIEDLLGRDVISFENSVVEGLVKGKTVLITGGGGSIGSELCRQVAAAGPAKLIIFDIYENNAYEIQQELKHNYGDQLELHVEIASVRDEAKVDTIFERYHPQIVFHAAAHKHVPLMEDCPEEAVKNNIFGTYHVVSAADRFHVEHFVLISTDKAVNPTNVMGATKRFCEMILQGMQQESETKYVAVRFGNVLGSNGSVIPLFQKQIAAGGPVTITDKRIIRYFMTIPEAVQLVLQAGAMAQSSEVFVLDMGQPVRILDLAENLIKLSGKVPGKDIKIVETGLRPGEKLYEELLIAGNGLTSTENEKIYVEKQPPIAKQELLERLAVLKRTADSQESAQVIKALHAFVPTFKKPEEVNAQGVIQVDYETEVAKHA